MDTTVAITLVATILAAICTPMDWFVSWRYYRAWRGGDSIPYFAPTLLLIGTVACAATVVLVVGAIVLFDRVENATLLPGGVGLLLIALGLLLPSAALVWLWRLLRERTA